MADKHETHGTHATHAAAHGSEATPKKPEPTKPMAGDGEDSVTKEKMAGSPVGTIKGDVVDRKKAVEEAAKHIQSDIPLTMSDKDALELGREIESRYMPPPPVPSVLEQIEEMNKPKSASAKS